MKDFSMKDNLYIGFMLFALFFGAGNLIFPPALGHAAGTNIWEGIIGFLITSVGLPILGVTAIAKSGNLQTLTNRVHPKFSIFFTITTYLCLGPFLVIPRAGSVAFEMGAVPFLPNELTTQGISLFIYTIFYFSFNFWLCLNPSKLFDRIGKILTPIILGIITIIFIQSLFHPVGGYGIPSQTYEHNAVFKGIIDGYLTMDALSALLFGSVVIAAIEKRGIHDSQNITRITIRTGIIAGVCLGIIYMMLGHLGATSQSLLNSSGNGGLILTTITTRLFGNSGNVLLGLVFTLACLTTSIGLITSCSQYFSRIIPLFSYKKWVGILCFISMILANLGLNQIILISVPILTIIYPLTIVLIILSFFHKYFKGYSSVYVGCLTGTALISIVDGLKQSKIEMNFIENLYDFIPLYEIGLGWILPAICGAFIGYLWGILKNDYSYQSEYDIKNNINN
ncbi:branched-chain amino acid transport system II carrier protein [Bacillus wiedmannii]|uniref:branched-chain amino acid transport system II carrier protein n=1 Tax=Bacillus wiedmannii TaxID=1890302 RepID=UPI000BEF6FC8|nr:branched-chain amino acid transport system II carrier protein [Bacillus wiedmannii]PEK00222.1 branched-chain amino acid transport system II carrier protein [Bacillus wiedmannii]PEM34476.1 branched-chain amino acid transport system II carrier protein [Bacillus wiedmannii]PEP31803.1 branched-chain amino acid transport system II carrier protein [Bacillus wiedmannii]PFZ34098.1 branched-chain amino acid transport system II carrier protein [Bacillus wiedmannii]PGA79408.1 branched-chain amino acid